MVWSFLLPMLMRGSTWEKVWGGNGAGMIGKLLEVKVIFYD